MRAWFAVNVSDKLQDPEMHHLINHSFLSVDGWITKRKVNPQNKNG